MEQIEQYIQGERDYTKIKGGTGPLVYPAAHVYIYWALYHITSKGRDILLAQRIFGVLYLATIAVVMACYRRARVAISSFGHDFCLIGDNLLITSLFVYRHLFIYSPCSSFRNVSIAFSFYAYSTTVSPFSSSGSPFMLSNAGCGHLVV